jgi:Uma2 family endonuclease
MSTTTHLTFEDFRNLPEDDGKIYELDHGELLVTPSPTVSHNRIRDRIFVALKEFVDGRQLGEIMLEMDFRLESSTVRKPDVAFVTQDHLARIDAESWPVNGAPALAVEVISPGNAAQDVAAKIRQYLLSGCLSVWIVYPKLRSIEIHTNARVGKIEAPALLTDEKVLPGFSIPLDFIFDGKK